MILVLGLLAPLAALSVIASDMPRGLAWPLATLAFAHGLRLLWLERRKPARSLVIGADGTTVVVDGETVAGFSLQWRGPLAFARWRDGSGRVQCLVWWPDTLQQDARRELRMAALAPATSPTLHSMAT